MGLTLLATALFRPMTSDGILQPLDYEVEPVHLQPFIRCNYEPCPALGYGRGTRIYESVFHHGPCHFSEHQVLSALCSVGLAAYGVFTEIFEQNLIGGVLNRSESPDFDSYERLH